MDKKLSLKLLIDSKTNRVLFAEAGKEVIDFLFSLLALPVGTIVNLLSKDGMVGCIGQLHSSLEQLDESYLLSEEKKSSLLNPHVFSTQISDNLLPLPPPPPPPPSPLANKSFYRCSASHHNYFTDIPGTTCPNCNYGMDSSMSYVGSSSQVGIAKQEEVGGGFVKGVVTYSIMDDLSVVPMSTISSITLLNKFQVKDLGSLQEKTIKLGTEEGLKLLKASLLCKNVLTTVFLGKKHGM
ncbi:hypothetical protein LUZ60_010628 [Juncus effusus]|nr:hypothetical protein LUZ60_010628 [Juncus effusus]